MENSDNGYRSSVSFIKMHTDLFSKHVTNPQYPVVMKKNDQLKEGSHDVIVFLN